MGSTRGNRSDDCTVIDRVLVSLIVALSLADVKIRWVDDEARTVIDCLQDSRVTANELMSIFATEGYKRLKERELGMKREFTDDAFERFLEVPPAPTDELQKTLDGWSKLDFNKLGQRAAVYLPSSAKLEASVYPLIKPLPNSFVWDVTTRPAIMLSLDPAKKPDEVAMTVTHELHHIGYASCCPNKDFEAWSAGQSASRQEAWKWAGAFGEGYAVLAAATDRNNPLGPSNHEVREAWHDGMTHLDRDFLALETFFVGTASAKLTSEQTQDKAMTFYGLQGPWYTVGYVLATTIEDAFGRGKLLSCYEDPRKLFATYNMAVKKLARKQPVWSPKLLAAMTG